MNSNEEFNNSIRNGQHNSSTQNGTVYESSAHTAERVAKQERRGRVRKALTRVAVGAAVLGAGVAAAVGGLKLAENSQANAEAKRQAAVEAVTNKALDNLGGKVLTAYNEHQGAIKMTPENGVFKFERTVDNPLLEDSQESMTVIMAANDDGTPNANETMYAKFFTTEHRSTANPEFSVTEVATAAGAQYAHPTDRNYKGGAYAQSHNVGHRNSADDSLLNTATLYQGPNSESLEVAAAEAAQTIVGGMNRDYEIITRDLQ